VVPQLVCIPVCIAHTLFTEYTHNYINSVYDFITHITTGLTHNIHLVDVTPQRVTPLPVITYKHIHRLTPSDGVSQNRPVTRNRLASGERVCGLPVIKFLDFLALVHFSRCLSTSWITVNLKYLSYNILCGIRTGCV
jgi:hypothetical protein